MAHFQVPQTPDEWLTLTEAGVLDLMRDCALGDEIKSIVLALYRDAVLRSAAAKIRAEAKTGDLNAHEYGTHANVLDAADLIDPDEQGS